VPGLFRLAPSRVTRTALHRHTAGQTLPRAWPRAWQDALGHRAHHRVAALVSTTSHPLRTAGRYSRSVPQARLLSDLLELSTTGMKFILLGTLRSRRDTPVSKD